MLLIVLGKSNQSDVKNHKDMNKRLWVIKKTALTFHQPSYQCAMKYLLMAGQD